MVAPVTIGARLTNDGKLLSAGAFDETTQNTHSITRTNIFADEFDEVTLGEHAQSGGSLALVGTGQVNVAGSSDFQFGTNDFTVEGWFYLTANSFTRLWSFPDGDNLEVSGTTVYYWNGGSPVSSGSGVFNLNQWNHVALVKRSGVVNVYINGTSVITDNSPLNSTTSRPVTIGGIVTGATGNPATDGLLNGYIGNFRIVKGTAVYTANFSPAYIPLTVVTNKKLLLLVKNQTTLLADESGTSKSVTSVGSVVYSALTPLSTSYNGTMKQLKNGTLQVYDEFDEVTTIV
jgi:hypothetical protein